MDTNILISDYQVLYDKVIGIELIADDEQDNMKINFSNGGPKADITMEVSLIPGNNFHQLTVTIKNFNIAYDIKKFKYMYVTAGYRAFKDDLGTSEYKKDFLGGTYESDFEQDAETVTKTFGMEIFYSYCLSPPPNGDTVFKGVVVSNESISTNAIPVAYLFTEKRKFTMEIYKNLTLEQYIEKVQKWLEAVGYVFEIDTGNLKDKGLLSKEIIANSISQYGVIKSFASPMDVLMSIKNMLDSYCVNSNASSYCSMTVIGKRVKFSILDGTFNEEELESKPWVHLHSVSNVTLNAGVMTVNAPWIPQLEPGDIIEVSREYINGQELPNIIDIDEILGVNNKYRIITMNIKFASVNNDNEMLITAIPLQYATGTVDSLSNKKESFVMDVAELRKEKTEDNAEDSALLIEGESAYQNAIGAFLEEKVFPKNDADDYPGFRDFLGFNKDKKASSNPEVVTVWTTQYYAKLCKEYYSNKGFNLIYDISEQASGKAKYYDCSYLWPFVYAIGYTQAREGIKTLYWYDKKGDMHTNKNASAPEYKDAFNSSSALNTTNGDTVYYPALEQWQEINTKYHIRLAAAELYKAAANLKAFENDPDMRADLMKLSYLMTNIDKPKIVGFK